MVTRTPAGFSAEQWKEITRDLDPGSSTVNDYRKVLNLLHSTGKYQILTMTLQDASDYFAYLDERVSSGELSENTAHRYKATLRALGRRIESCPSFSPEYTNPFNGLVKNEKRLRTTYSREMFASPDDVVRIRSNLDKLNTRDHLMIEMILFLGLTPRQIQNIRVCDFFHTEDGTLALKIDEGTVLEKTKKDREISDLFLSGAPVTYVSSSSRSITWKYTASFLFGEEVTGILRRHIPTIGGNHDTRKFFLTSRHLEYNYRALHHLVHVVCNLSGIEEVLTPNQLSLSGMIRSKLNQEKEDLSTDCWTVFPLPLEEKLKVIEEQLGKDFIESYRDTL